MKQTNWFLTAKQYTLEQELVKTGSGIGASRTVVLLDQLLTASCKSCDALATGYDSFAVPYCCEACMRGEKCQCASHARSRSDRVFKAGGQS